MKGALGLCDGASTVSPSYAREVTSDPELGFGLEDVLRNKGERFVGILNGADYGEWNPAMTIAKSRRSTPRRCRTASANAPAICATRSASRIGTIGALIGMVTRITSQKGGELLRDALDEVMALGVQLVMLASGDKALEEFFKRRAQALP